MTLVRPFWLSPRQVVVIPVAAPYARIISLVVMALTDCPTHRKSTRQKSLIV